MALTIDSIGILQEYINGVIGRAEHHANNVTGVALTLLGAVMWRSTSEIEVREYNGRPANILWFWVGDRKYALVYNHSTLQIELRESKHNGTTIAVFDNSSTYQQILQEFTRL